MFRLQGRDGPQRSRISVISRCYAVSQVQQAQVSLERDWMASQGKHDPPFPGDRDTEGF